MTLKTQLKTRSHLAHHFRRLDQQHDAAKLGMWFFLATEVLMFGGLFCAYAVFRWLHPELFSYGSQFLDPTWGAINTVVLILSSLTMALAVWCAQINHRGGLVVFLLFTLLFAVDFLVIKTIEYSHKFHENLVWGVAFYDRDSRDVPTLTAAKEERSPEAETEKAQKIWRDVCRTCHGAAGEGVANQGKDLRGSAFITQRSDREILDFLKKGRMAGDAENSTGIMMPPRGGNPLLRDDDLASVIPMIREFASAPGVPERGDVATADAPGGLSPAIIPASVVPPAASGPSGLLTTAMARNPFAGDLTSAATDPARPANAHIFFGLYFCMTGLHGLHVVGGVVLISILIGMSWIGWFGSAYFTPVELGGLYWHIVDIIWIFLFPLLYLIG